MWLPLSCIDNLALKVLANPQFLNVAVSCHNRKGSPRDISQIMSKLLPYIHLGEPVPYSFFLVVSLPYTFDVVSFLRFRNMPMSAILPEIKPVKAPYIKWNTNDPPIIIGYNP